MKMISRSRSCPANALTVDVEDWPQSTLNHALPITFRVVSNTRKLLEIFSRFKVKATFFVLGRVVEVFPYLVREIADLGHEVATHGFSHEPVYKMTPEEFRRDIKASKRLIESNLGQKIIGYRAPDFSITEQSSWAWEVLSEEGILYDSSIFPIYGPRYGIPTASRFPYWINKRLYEVPLSTVQVAGINFPACGGGYLRFMPYWMTDLCIRRINSEGHGGVIYIHPYEIDSEEMGQIKTSIPVITRFSQGWNREKTQSKLERLLTNFHFTSIQEIISNDN